MSKCGSRMRPTLSMVTSERIKQDEIGRNMKLVSADECDQLLEQESQVDPVERQLGVRVHQLADIAAKGPGVNLIAPDVEGVERGSTRSGSWAISPVSRSAIRSRVWLSSWPNMP